MTNASQRSLFKTLWLNDLALSLSAYEMLEYLAVMFLPFTSYLSTKIDKFINEHFCSVNSENEQLLCCLPAIIRKMAAMSL